MSATPSPHSSAPTSPIVEGAVNMLAAELVAKTVSLLAVHTVTPIKTNQGLSEFHTDSSQAATSDKKQDVVASSEVSNPKKQTRLKAIRESHMKLNLTDLTAAAKTNPLDKILVSTQKPEGVDLQIWELSHLAPLISETVDNNLKVGYFAWDLDDVMIQQDLKTYEQQYTEAGSLDDKLKLLKSTFPNSRFILLTHTEGESNLKSKLQTLQPSFPCSEFDSFEPKSRFEPRNKGEMLKSRLEKLERESKELLIIFIDNDSSNLKDVKKIYGDRVITVQYLGSTENMLAIQMSKKHCDTITGLWGKCLGTDTLSQIYRELSPLYRQWHENIYAEKRKKELVKFPA
ncbi:DUF2608 domain-containing protein [Parashewanella curva]|uniref:DUF2608 domain-containing protein n=1 Tax=Parashewanella curva TaxID=2338552 RepID=A0A3L8PYW9_9GAMM|nr:DUF2608 domain-containing protein [Parashewanella curva]RLV60587.1 DUF2608 domain-containing protein [Parashewanella curva]